jgi:hypothetical protein
MNETTESQIDGGASRSTTVEESHAGTECIAEDHKLFDSRKLRFLTGLSPVRKVREDLLRGRNAKPAYKPGETPVSCLDPLCSSRRRGTAHCALCRKAGFVSEGIPA